MGPSHRLERKDDGPGREVQVSTLKLFIERVTQVVFDKVVFLEVPKESSNS